MQAFRNLIARRRPTGADAFASMEDQANGDVVSPVDAERDDLQDAVARLELDLEQVEPFQAPAPSGEPDVTRESRPMSRPNFPPIPPETSTAAPAPRAKIWEMDAGKPAPSTAKDARPVVKMPEQRAPQPEPISGPKPVAPAAPQRTKTRLLGFGGQNAFQDVFSSDTAPVSAGHTMFPIGWLVIMDGPGRGASFTLAAGLSSIGRDTDQTVSIDFGDSSISRQQHAAIAYDEEENITFIGHGGKSNIVRLNDKPLLTTEELNDGDRVKIGETEMKFFALCDADFQWNTPPEDEDPNFE